MASLYETIRGDRLTRVDTALADLEADPRRLEHVRVRFDDSPPPYTSDQSSTTTLSQSPNPPPEDQRRRYERQRQLARDYSASQPYLQFEAQTCDEEKRIWEAHDNGSCKLRVGDSPNRMAHENVKKQWIEQGIWNDNWGYYANGNWKHEEPLKLESEAETESEEASAPPLFSFSREQPRRKPRPPKSDEERRRIAERRVQQGREREASRPYFQFVFQVSKERERLQDDVEAAQATDLRLDDINTRAYVTVKNIWTRRGIWNNKWGILPGMSWKHEQPLKEFLGDRSAERPTSQLNRSQPDPSENGSHNIGSTAFQVDRAPFRNLFGHDVIDSGESGSVMRDSSPTDPNHFRAPRRRDKSQETPPVINGLAAIGNNDPECSRSMLTSTGTRTGQPSQIRKRKSPHQRGKQHPMAETSRVFNSSKILETSRGNRSRPRRHLQKLENSSSDNVAQLSAPSMDKARRRSERMRQKRDAPNYG